EFGERGQNVVLHSLGEKGILLVVAEIDERQHGNAFFGKDDLCRWNFGWRFRWILRSAAPKKERGNAQRQDGCSRQQDWPETAAVLRLGNRSNMFCLVLCGRECGLRYSPRLRSCIGLAHFDIGDKAVAAARHCDDVVMRTR